MSLRCAIQKHDRKQVDARACRVSRRDCIYLMAGAAMLGPLAATAQGMKLQRIGFLGTVNLENPLAKVAVDAFRQGLKALGYVEGRNVTIVYRSADGDFSRLTALTRELLELNVDVILAPNTPAARAARRATATVPIVVPGMGDPVSDGLVNSLARPGTNVTGYTFLGPELVPKRLALLQEMLPTVKRVSGLVHPEAYSQRTMKGMLDQVARTADILGLELQLVQARGRDRLEPAFNAMTGEALFVFPSVTFFNARKYIVALATQHRLPAIFQDHVFVKLGGLMSYGTDIIDLFRQAATPIVRILNGAKPSELPVEQPTKFELVINLKTAKELGLSVPTSLLVRADYVIE